MKKLSALLWSIPFLTPAIVAAEQIDLCPPDASQFDNLCGEVGIGPVIGTVITFIFIIAIIIALIFLIYGGLKWVVSGGDKGKVEEARGTIIAAIIGLIVVFLSYLILNFVLQLFGINLNNLVLPQINLIDTTPNTPDPGA